jgi:hypothetical protein
MTAVDQGVKLGLAIKALGDAKKLLLEAQTDNSDEISFGVASLLDDVWEEIHALKL